MKTSEAMRLAAQTMKALGRSGHAELAAFIPNVEELERELEELQARMRGLEK